MPDIFDEISNTGGDIFDEISRDPVDTNLAARQKFLSSAYLNNPGLAPEEREQRLVNVGRMTGEADPVQTAVSGIGKDALSHIPGSVTRDVVSGVSQSAIGAAGTLLRPLETVGVNTDVINRVGGSFLEGNQELNKDSMVPGMIHTAIEGTARTLGDILFMRGAGVPAGTRGVGYALGFGVNSANNALTEARDAGLNEGEALTYAAEQGVLEAAVATAFSAFGKGGVEQAAAGTQVKEFIKKYASNGIKQALSKLAKATGTTMAHEVPEEMITTVLQGVSSYFHDVNSSVDYGKLIQGDPEELRHFGQELAQVALTTAMTAGAVETQNITRGYRLGDDPSGGGTAKQAGATGAIGETEDGPKLSGKIAHMPTTGADMEEVGPVLATANGIEFEGVQEADEEDDIPAMMVFTDPKTESTLYVGPGEIVEDKLRAMRVKFGVVEEAEEAPPKESRIQRGIQTAAAAIRVTKDALNDNVIYPERTYKRDTKFVELKEQRPGAVALAGQVAVDWNKRLSAAIAKSGVTNRTREYNFKLKKTLEGKIDYGHWPAEIADVLAEGRKLMDQASQRHANALVDVGLEDRAETIESNIGKYVMYIPRWTLDPISRVAHRIRNAGSRGLSLSQHFGTARRDSWMVTKGLRNRVVGKFESEADAMRFYNEQPEAVRKNFKVKPPRTEAERYAEDIHDLGFLLAAGMTTVTHDTEMLHLHKYVADNFGVKPSKELRGKPGAVEEWATSSGLVKMPHEGKFHALSDVYVPEAMASDLLEITEMPGMVASFFRAYNRAYKTGILVYNPATWMRDWMGNTLIFSTFARTSPVNPANWKYYKSALSDLVGHKGLWSDATQRSVIGTEFANIDSRELKQLALSDAPMDAGMLMRVLGKLDSAARSGHGSADALFKMAAYHKYISEGMDPDQAAEEVKTWFPDYSRVSTLARKLSNEPVFGHMFARFTDQSMRIAWRALKKHPLRMAMLLALPGVLNAVGKYGSHVGDDEEEVLRSGQGWVENYFTPIVGRDGKGNAVMFDLRYIYILANDIFPKINAAKQMYIPWLLNTPLANAALDQMTGMNRFSGKKFEGRDESFNIASRAKGLANNLMPLPALFRYGPSRVHKAATSSEPGREDVAKAMLGVITGINLRRPYVAQRNVEDAVVDLIMQGEYDTASIMLDIWNEQYKPDNYPVKAGEEPKPFPRSKFSVLRARANRKLLEAENE